MKIRVVDIPEEGLDVDIDQDAAWAVTAAEQAMEGPVSDLSLALHLSLIAELLRVSGEARATARRTCDRCGGEVDISVDGDVELLYEPHRHDALQEEHITDEAELDLGFFDGVALDMSEVVSEQLALWLPPKVLCGAPGVAQVGEPWTCELPEQDEGPDLSTHKPFANLRLPE